MEILDARRIEDSTSKILCGQSLSIALEQNYHNHNKNPLQLAISQLLIAPSPPPASSRAPGVPKNSRVSSEDSPQSCCTRSSRCAPPTSFASLPFASRSARTTNLPPALWNHHHRPHPLDTASKLKVEDLGVRRSRVTSRVCGRTWALKGHQMVHATQKPRPNFSPPAPRHTCKERQADGRQDGGPSSPCHSRPLVRGCSPPPFAAAGWGVPRGLVLSPEDITRKSEGWGASSRPTEAVGGGRRGRARARPSLGQDPWNSIGS